MIFKFLLIIVSILFSYNDLSLYPELSAAESALLDKKNTNNNLNSAMQTFEETVVLDASINPKEYIVGPGDEFAFNMISSDGSIIIPLIVSPIGDVLIPNIGNIRIDGLILEDAINKIIRTCKEKYNTAEIFINLVNVRKFNIQIFGPGLDGIGYLPASPIHRLSYIYNTVSSKINDFKYSIRNIEIIRDNKSTKYDLLSFFIFGNVDSNPYLHQNDKIKFYIVSETINISGAVNIPAELEYSKNESLHDVIQLSGGLTNNADSNYIEITRFINDEEYDKIICDSYNFSKTIEVKPYDEIRVRKRKEFKRAEYISISGEINFPGNYLLSEIETYKDLINIAGGYTDFADRNQIYINNEVIAKTSDLEVKRILLIPQMDRTSSEISYLKARKKISKGSIVSNDDIFTNKIMNFIPEPQDEIYIPRKFEYIEVIGAVKHPGRYAYIKGKKCREYIDLSGGKSTNATNNIFIIKAADSQRIPFKRNVVLDSGDIIFIEEKEDFNKFNRFKDMLQIIGNVSAFIAVIQNLSN